MEQVSGFDRGCLHAPHPTDFVSLRTALAAQSGVVLKECEGDALVYRRSPFSGAWGAMRLPVAAQQFKDWYDNAGPGGAALPKPFLALSQEEQIFVYLGISGREWDEALVLYGPQGALDQGDAYTPRSPLKELLQALTPITSWLVRPIDGGCDLYRLCPNTQGWNGMRLCVPAASVESWYEEGGKNPWIQSAFPTLNRKEREFIFSGITATEWVRMFGDEQDPERGQAFAP